MKASLDRAKEFISENRAVIRRCAFLFFITLGTGSLSLGIAGYIWLAYFTPSGYPDEDDGEDEEDEPQPDPPRYHNSPPRTKTPA